MHFFLGGCRAPKGFISCCLPCKKIRHELSVCFVGCLFLRQSPFADLTRIKSFWFILCHRLSIHCSSSCQSQCTCKGARCSCKRFLSIRFSIRYLWDCILSSERAVNWELWGIGTRAVGTESQFPVGFSEGCIARLLRAVGYLPPCSCIL
jgi:hypothetical protein